MAYLILYSISSLQDRTDRFHFKFQCFTFRFHFQFSPQRFKFNVQRSTSSTTVVNSCDSKIRSVVLYFRIFDFLFCSFAYLHHSSNRLCLCVVCDFSYLCIAVSRSYSVTPWPSVSVKTSWSPTRRV